jgi:predicted aldo/keto reductase-like oxidoreductase
VAVGERFSEEEKAAYKQEAEKIAPNLNNICRECMHCLEKFECTQRINFPGILSLYVKHQISEKLGKDTSHLTEQYKNLEMDAEASIECGLCIPWCEYKFNFPEMLKEAHKVLGQC